MPPRPDFASPRVVTLCVVALLAGSAWLVALPRLGVDWATWQPATCMPDHCFCEAVREGAIRQPANSASSLAFVLAALAIAGAMWRRRPMSYALIVGLIVVGLGSAFYHASLTLVGQFLDVAGMYLVVSAMLVYAWGRRYRLPLATIAALYLALNVVLDGLLIALPDTRRWLFAVVLGVALAVEAHYLRTMRPVIERRWLYAGLALFAAAYATWIADNQRWLCAPHRLMQGHALWHIGGAAAMGLLALYYRSERARG